MQSLIFCFELQKVHRSYYLETLLYTIAANKLLLLLKNKNIVDFLTSSKLYAVFSD